MYAAAQAIALARQASACAERLDGPARHERVLAAAMQSASQHRATTRFAEEVADFQLAERAAQAMGDPVAQVHALFGQAASGFLAKQISLVRRCGARAMQVAATSGSAGAVGAGETMMSRATTHAARCSRAQNRSFDRWPTPSASPICGMRFSVRPPSAGSPDRLHAVPRPVRSRDGACVIEYSHE
jgi:hypothetical protein